MERNKSVNPAQLGLGGEFGISSQVKPIEVTITRPHVSSVPEEKTKQVTTNTDIASKQKALRKKYLWHEDRPTDRQILRITRMCITLGIEEPLEEKVSNKMEARDRIYELLGKLRRHNLERKEKASRSPRKRV